MAHTANMHLEVHQHAYRVRRVVPANLRPVIGSRKLVSKPLGRIDRITYEEAKSLAYPISREFDAILEQARAGTYTPDDMKRYTHPAGPGTMGCRISKQPPPADGGRWVWQEKADIVSLKPVPFKSVVEVWELSTENSKSKRDYAGAMEKLALFVGHDDAARVTSKDIKDFREALQKSVKPKYNPNTINKYLSRFDAMFEAARERELIPTNPMDGVKRVKGKKSTRRNYTVDEVALILTEGQKAEPHIRFPTLVQGFAGCRVSEVVDCHTSDVEKIGETWVLHVREDNREAGQCVKNDSSVRTFALHPEVVKSFIPYVQSLEAGPLFPLIPKSIDGKRSDYAIRVIGEWIRGTLVITDENLAPNHSFRHYVKSWFANNGVSEKISDSITGHSTKGRGRKYEHVDLEAQLAAVLLLPNPLS
jgi:integrase